MFKTGQQDMAEALITMWPFGGKDICDMVMSLHGCPSSSGPQHHHTTDHSTHCFHTGLLPWGSSWAGPESERFLVFFFNQHSVTTPHLYTCNLPRRFILCYAQKPRFVLRRYLPLPSTQSSGSSFFFQPLSGFKIWPGSFPP